MESTRPARTTARPTSRGSRASTPRRCAANDQNVAQLQEAGHDVEGCPINFGETAPDVVRDRIAHKKYDAVLIGAGVRLVASNTLLFEALVNLVHAEPLEARFVYNLGPEATPDDIRRWFPDPDA